MLIRTDGPEGERCLGFTFQQQGWHLQAGEPIFALGASWAETFPELAEAVPLDDWRQAWHGWLQSRGLVEGESAPCRLERSGYRLHVQASPALLQRFRSLIRPAVQDDIWLLAGPGRFREAVHVELA